MKIKQLLEWIGLSKTSTIGVDMEASSSVLLLLTQKHNIYQLKFIEFTEMPPESFNKGVIDNPSFIGQHLAKSISTLNTNNMYSAIAAPAKLVTTLDFKLSSKLNERKQEEAAYLEAKKSFQNIMDKLYLDFAMKPNYKNQDENFNDFMLVAAHKNAIQGRIDATQKAGIPAKILDVDYLALERGYHLIEPNLDKTGDNDNIAVLDLSTSRMLLTVYHKNELIHFYHHTYHINGLGALVRYHIKNLNNNPEDLGRLNLDSDQLTENQQQQLMNQVQYILKTFLPDSYSSQINQLIISGRCMLIPGIAELIESTTQIKTQAANPFKDMLHPTSVSPELIEHYAPACLLACGLAMRNIPYDKY